MLRAGLLALFVWLVHPILTPIVLGALFALLLHPLYERLGSVPLVRRFRTTLVTLGALLLVVVPFVGIAAAAASSINEFLGQERPQLGEVQGTITRRVLDVARDLGFPTDEVRTWISRALREIGQAIASLAGGIVKSIPAAILGAFLFGVGLFYFLRDGPAMTGWLERHSPFEARSGERLFDEVQKTVRGAILGTFAAALVQGVLTTIALWIFDVPGFVLFGIIATIFSLIPMVGTTPVTVGAMIYLAASGRMGAALGMTVAAVLIGTSDNVVRPWVQGKGGEMHPLLAFLGIFGGLATLGAAGIFIGPVVAAIGLWALRSSGRLRIE